MIILGCLFNPKDEKKILQNSKGDLSNATNIFQWNLIDGFLENNQDLKIINISPIGTFPRHYKKLLLKTKEWQYRGIKCQEIGSLNLPFIKQHQRYRKAKKILKKTDDRNILIYSTYEPFLKAIYKMPRKYNITLIVPDLPEFYDLQKTNPFRKIARKINNKKIYKYLSRIDNYVLLTEKMKEKLPVGNKPYTVIEGICHPPSKNTNTLQEKDKDFILYAGSYRLSNGIENLLKAFSNIKNDKIELWLCGKGEATPLIKKYAQKDSRIKDLGYRSHTEILQLEKSAKLLVNPRPNTDEYTNYSFPSKTMEYIVSGTPVLMYKLAGIPQDYYSHLYLIKDGYTKELQESIIQIISKPKKELNDFGQKNKNWILKNKNGKTQSSKIIKLIMGAQK